MAKDNVLVRKINGLETAGSLNILFSDKTGTITSGKLSVVEISAGDLKHFTSLSSVSHIYANAIATGIGINNSASAAHDGTVIGGNSTDRALMAYLVDEKWHRTWIRAVLQSSTAFDSAKKYSSVVVEADDKKMTFIKGAPEKIIARCTKFMDAQGKIKPFEDPCCNGLLHGQTGIPLDAYACCSLYRRRLGCRRSDTVMCTQYPRQCSPRSGCCYQGSPGGRGAGCNGYR